jgi:hypothetical protein
MDESEFGFTHEHAQHRIIFRDDKLIESLGRDNPTYRYKAPMREDLFVAPWAGANLFTKVYPDLLAACLDRSRGILIDPFHGARPAKCASLREIRNVNRRDGIDVELEFILAPEEGEVITDLGSEIRSIPGATLEALRIDQALAKVDYPPQLPPPDPLVDPFDAISGIGDQLDVAQGKINAKLLDVASRAERAADTIDKLKKPELASTRAAALRLQAAAIRMEETIAVGRARPVRTVITKTNAGLASLAALHGMTVEEFLKLNPDAARTPMVKANTEIRIFFDTSKANASGRTAGS